VNQITAIAEQAIANANLVEEDGTRGRAERKEAMDKLM